MGFLTKLSLRKRWLTFLVVILIALGSIYATFRIKMELIPDIELPFITVMTSYPGRLPGEVQEDVTIPIEKAIAESESPKYIESTSAENFSFVFAEFEYGTKMKKVESSLSQKLEELDLPSGCEPQLIRLTPAMMPLVILSLSGDLEPEELRSFAENNIEPQIQAIEGISSITLEGGEAKKLVVQPDPAKMAPKQISMWQITQVLELTPVYSSPGDIEDVVIAPGITVADVAEVSHQPVQDPRGAIIRTNGSNSVSIMVFKDPEANAVTAANAVMDDIGSLDLPEGVQIYKVMDQSDFIERSISDLTREALIGAALAIIVIFLFLRSRRASLVTCVSIPLSILIGFFVMYWWGITINILTLSAMAIAVGRVVDDSIVVLENIYRHLQQGEGFRQAALNGAREVATPITSATIATVAIFLPLAFVGGIVGELFQPFALTITFALLASLLVALMVVPPLSSFITTKKISLEGEEAWYHRLYTRTLKWALSHRALTLIIAAVLFFGSFALLPLIGTTFIPSTSEKYMLVNIEMPQGTDLNTTSQTASQVEGFVDEKLSDVEIYDTMVGTSMMGGFADTIAGSNTATLYIQLHPDADLEGEADQLHQFCDSIAPPGSIIEVYAGPSGEMEMYGMSSNSLNLIVTGDREQVDEAAETIATSLAGMQGLENVESDVAAKMPMLDPQKVSQSGLNLQQEFMELRQIVMGQTVAQINFSPESYEVFVDAPVGDPQSMMMLPVGPQGNVFLGQIVGTPQPVVLQRINQEDAATVTASITQSDIGRVEREVQKEIDGLNLQGVDVTMGGVMEQMEESFRDMGIAIIAAIVIAYIVMVITLRSWLNPLIIMVSLPLASIGAFLGLFITQRALGVSALMGVLMLVGIVLTNAIVLITFVEQLRKEGVNTRDALIQGGRIRLRPILMTALTTMVALIPLSLGFGEGTLIAAELAIVVIGGLLTSTLLTLLVIPVIYSLVERIRRRPPLPSPRQ